jgi:hypothetical protein
MELLNEMQVILDAAKENAAKFKDKGNMAAGTRLRVGMQDIKKKAQEVRLEVSEVKSQAE